MMRSTEAAIQLRHVSKRYERHSRTIWDVLSRTLSPTRLPASDTPDSWAIRDLNCTVQCGDTLGLVGQNGAGKSTILKMIAGITAPTFGDVIVHGRVASLIELGAGFNPELTGRENIYLNGAVHGLGRREISHRYEEIADFSGLGRFLDIPVKYYSSGMYARLGFAIAVNVEADIVLTDEVLAVGDASFQSQCLKKFDELTAKSTVVFVSHDLSMMKKICTRAIWIEAGRLECSGQPEKVIDAYLERVQRDRESQSRRPLSPEAGAARWGSGEIELMEVFTCDSEGHTRNVFRTFEDIIVHIRYRINGTFSEPGFGVKIHSGDGAMIHGTNTFIKDVPVALMNSTGLVEVRYTRVPLLTGVYWITAGVTSANNWNTPYDVRERAHKFEILTSYPDGGGIALGHHWNVAGHAF